MTAWLSNQLEPSRLRATILAGLGLALALGLITAADMPGWVDWLLAGWAPLYPVLQHKLVRPKVVPVDKVRMALEATRYERAETRTADLQAMLVTGEIPATPGRGFVRASPAEEK